MASLSYARYGKDNVRVYKVQRNADGTQDVTEMTVCTLLEGDIAASWTKADNANIVATDTQKQTIYLMAKLHPVNPTELFASILGQHFIDTYSHIHAAHVSITVHRWARMEVEGKPHPHSFFRDGAETRVVEAVARRNAGISIQSGIKGLLVLKSTGSQFWGFHRDEYTRLPEVWDRILSTEVEAAWSWKHFESVAEVRQEQAIFDQAWRDARTITLETFATENSPSVQNTMYIMSEKILAKAARVERVDYSLPNKHYFEIGPQEHRERRRSLRPTERSQRSDSMHRHQEEHHREVIAIVTAGDSLFAFSFLNPFALKEAAGRRSGSDNSMQPSCVRDSSSVAFHGPAPRSDFSSPWPPESEPGPPATRLVSQPRRYPSSTASVHLSTHVAGETTSGAYGSALPYTKSPSDEIKSSMETHWLDVHEIHVRTALSYQSSTEAVHMSLSSCYGMQATIRLGDTEIKERPLCAYRYIMLWLWGRTPCSFLRFCSSFTPEHRRRTVTMDAWIERRRSRSRSLQSMLSNPRPC
nr:uricase [Quercus suber]